MDGISSIEQGAINIEEISVGREEVERHLKSGNRVISKLIRNSDYPITKYSIWLFVFQHQPFYAAGFAGVLIAFNDHTAEAGITGGRFPASWQVRQEALNDELLLYTDDAVVGAGHADIGLIRG